MKSVLNQFFRYSVMSCQIEAGTVPSLAVCEHEHTLLDRQMINKIYSPFVPQEIPFVLLERPSSVPQRRWNGGMATHELD